MASQTALIWAGTSGAAVAAAGAAAISFSHPSLLWPRPPPAAVVEPAGPPSEPSAIRAPGGKIAAVPRDPGAPSAPAATVKPAFDVVSVEPGGGTVVAGRAAPNVTVALLDGARTLGEAKTDSHGQFVIVPDPLTPGDHTLVLSVGAGGPGERSNPAPVSVAPPPTVGALPRANSPAPSAAPPPASGEPPEVAIRSVETNAQGRLAAEGVAPPNATVRLYVSGAFVGDARTGDDGRWSLTIGRGMSPGAYTVRADRIAAGDARVLARAEAPFSVPALAPQQAALPSSPAPAAPSPADVVINSVRTHHVERGHTLWGISEKIYGDGSRYEIIFSANAGQIRDPNLIYPGQTFVVPPPPGPKR